MPPTYTPNDEHVEVLADLDGAPVVRPKHRCELCAKATEEQYSRCYKCAYTDENQVGDDLHAVFAVGIYVDESAEGALRGRIETDSGAWDADVLHEYTEEIRAAKDGDHVEKMARLLARSVREHDALTNLDLLVPAPSGSADVPAENHVVPIGNRLETLVGIPHRHVTHGEFKSQRRQAGIEERVQNVRGAVRLTKSRIDAERALVIDDVATTCATLSDTARALHEAGVRDVLALVLGRNEDYRSLEDAGVLTSDR